RCTANGSVSWSSSRTWRWLRSRQMGSFRDGEPSQTLGSVVPNGFVRRRAQLGLGRGRTTQPTRRRRYLLGYKRRVVKETVDDERLRHAVTAQKHSMILVGGAATRAGDSDHVDGKVAHPSAPGASRGRRGAGWPVRVHAAAGRSAPTNPRPGKER